MCDVYKCREWLQQLWNWLGKSPGQQQQQFMCKGQNPLQMFICLPIVPLVGGCLAPLTLVHSCTLVSVWAHRVGSSNGDLHKALQALGLELVDSNSFNLLAQNMLQQEGEILLVPEYCHPGDPVGVLTALKIVALQSLAVSPQRAAAPGSVDRAAATLPGRNQPLDESEVLEVRQMFARRMAGLTVSQRRILRVFLLQDAGLSQTLRDQAQSSDSVTFQQVLTWIPFYEGAASVSVNNAFESAVRSELSLELPSSSINTLPSFQDLAGPLCVQQPSTCLVTYYIAREVISTRALPSQFLADVQTAETQFMLEHLGVKEMQPTDVYRLFILPNIAFYEPGLRDQVVLQMLLDLPNLIQGDADFEGFLRHVSFLPNRRVSCVWCRNVHPLKNILSMTECIEDGPDGAGSFLTDGI